MQLIHRLGDSPESTAVWIEDKGPVIRGDDFLKSYPNLPPIRGLKLRPPERWIAASDLCNVSDTTAAHSSSTGSLAFYASRLDRYVEIGMIAHRRL